MRRRYFEVIDDVDFPGRWHLHLLHDARGRQLDERDFTYGQRIDASQPLRLSLADEDVFVDVVEPLRVSVQYDGAPLGLTFAGLGAPVVTTAVAEMLSVVAHADIQRVPVTIDGYGSHFEIINVVNTKDCLDIERSTIQWFEEGNEIRPDLAGTPEMITKLVIDPDRVGNCHLLRPKGWEVVIVISDEIVTILNRAGVTGAKFRLVS